MPLSGFQSRMTVLQADSNFHFIQEYEGVTVPEEETYSTEVALSMVNANKNRYTNIIPCGLLVCLPCPLAAADLLSLLRQTNTAE